MKADVKVLINKMAPPMNTYYAFNHKYKCQNQSKNFHIFKIKPVEKNEVAKLKDDFLFLNGIKSNNVNNILAFVYPKKQSRVRMRNFA